MARIRTIKPEFWTDEKIVECSFEARLMFIGMFNFADDKGNLVRSHKRIKMQIFPADMIDCEPLIKELSVAGLISEYSVSGVEYIHIDGFSKHQKINRPSATTIPTPEDVADNSRKAGYLCADIFYQWRVLLRAHGENHGRNHQHAVKPDEATGQH